MIDYPLSELKAGKYFSQTVFLDENYILLSPEIPIDEALLKRLMHWDYVRVYSDGAMTDSQVTSSQAAGPKVGNLNTRLKEKAELVDASKHYVDILRFTESVFDKFVGDGDLDQVVINEKIKAFVNSIKDLRSYILRYSEFPGHENFLVLHSVRTIIIGIILGLDMRFPPHRLIELGIVCLLHEIGMTKLPSSLYMSDKILGDQEKRIISTHPVLGFKALRSRNFGMNICLGILESHENVDGSGYPQGIGRERISEYAKIVSIASSYVAMTSDRPFRVAMDGHSAILELLKKRDAFYDANIINILLKTLSVYPVGTFVQVKNGAKGMVVETFSDRPKNPIVKLILGPKGETYRECPIVNTTNADYQIIGVLPPSKAADLKAALQI